VVPKDAMQSFAVDGVMAQEVRFVSRDGEVVQAIVTRPESGSAVDSAPRSSPGAVAGEASDESLALMAEMMPAELIAAPVSGESEGAAAIRELQAFLKKGTVAEVAAQPFAGVSLTEDEAERVMRALRSRFEDEVRAAAKAEFESKVLEADGAKMPFWYAVYGDKPKSGRSLWISMHGGGGAPKQVNDGQWENQKKLYKPEEGVYVAPRAPTDTWNLWHQGHIDALFRKLITDMIVFEGVDPNRVYLMGYSAGGDGVYQLAPRMADSFAAAAMMAGHPNETRPDGLRNLPFALYMAIRMRSRSSRRTGTGWSARTRWRCRGWPSRPGTCGLRASSGCRTTSPARASTGWGTPSPRAGSAWSPRGRVRRSASRRRPMSRSW